jgi:hypothetical protein
MFTVHRLWLMGPVLLVVPTGLTRAGDREAALAVINAAIKAHGGDQALARAQTMVRNVTGKLSGGGEVAFTAETTLSLPGRARQTLSLDKAGQIVVVLNGDRGWSTAGGIVGEMGKDALENLQEEIYIEWLATVLPLRKDSFDLTALGDKTVDGQAAAGIKVASKGHGDARLYFDKASGLLVQAERQSKEAGIPELKEYIFGGHKDFDGVKLPTKRVERLKGTKIVEITSATYKFATKVDDATFGRP